MNLLQQILYNILFVHIQDFRFVILQRNIMDLGTQRGLGGFSPYEQFLQIFLRGKSVKKLSMDAILRSAAVIVTPSFHSAPVIF